MFMIHRKRLIIGCFIALLAMVFYLQVSFEENENQKNEITKDVLESSSSTYVSGSFEEVDFFSKAKLDRQITQSNTKNSIKDVLSSNDITSSLETDITDKLDRFVWIMDAQNKIETLVKERGYDDVFVAIADDGSIDMLVKAQSLASAEVAQIADIASRQADVPIANIHIKNKW